MLGVLLSAMAPVIVMAQGGDPGRPAQNDGPEVALPAFAGEYELPDGRLIFIAWGGYLGGDSTKQLQYFDSGSQRIALLSRDGATSQFAAGSGFRAAPVEVRVRFDVQRGAVRGLRWQLGDGPERYAARVTRSRQEEVSFRSGGARGDSLLLKGTLYLPLDTGRHPAVALLPMSSGIDRSIFYLLGNHLARNGIVALAYDKRGTGRSEGEWRRASLDDLADDGAAAARFLRTRVEVRSNAVGLHGGSQSGWVAPLASAREPGIAFLSMTAGSGEGPGEQEIFRFSYALRDTGAPEEVIARVAATWRAAYVARYATPVDAAAANAALDAERAGLVDLLTRAAATAPWRSVLVMPPSSSTVMTATRFVIEPNFNPASAFLKVKVPMLNLVGEFDEQAPAAVSAAVFREVAQRGCSADVRFVSLPKTFHGMVVGHSGSLRQDAASLRFLSPGYMHMITHWILQQAELIAVNGASGVQPRCQ